MSSRRAGRSEKSRFLPPQAYPCCQVKVEMTQAAKKNSLVVLINVFTVEPPNQERLVELLIRATDGLVNKAPGFISSTLHRSIDGTKVAMYAQWRSAEDYQAMRQNPEPLPFLQEALTIATFDPGMYEIVTTFAPA
jgi:quinol monooxygenase YgiN